jgi:hypothetical protein
MEVAIPNADLDTMITVMADEILRFINAIVANRTKDNPETHNMYSSKKDVDSINLTVIFGLHNAMTQTVVYKIYDWETFANICSDQPLIEATFNELVDYMLTQSNNVSSKTIVLNEN